MTAMPTSLTVRPNRWASIERTRMLNEGPVVSKPSKVSTTPAILPSSASGQIADKVPEDTRKFPMKPGYRRMKLLAEVGHHFVGFSLAFRF
jgi:hypothetical protein